MVRIWISIILKTGKQIIIQVTVETMKKKNEITIGITILSIGIIALFLDNPLTATLCVPIGASLIIFSKIMWFFLKN